MRECVRNKQRHGARHCSASGDSGTRPPALPDLHSAQVRECVLTSSGMVRVIVQHPETVGHGPQLLQAPVIVSLSENSEK